MAIRFSFFVTALSIANGIRASATAPLVSAPHKYFTKKIRQSVDTADFISPDARPYAATYPSIDIQPWINIASSTDEERQEVVQQVLAQAIGAGSFNIVGHNVSVDLLDRLETSTRKFFSQAIDFKRLFSSENPKAGYVANLEERYGATVYQSDNPYQNEGDAREIFTLVYPPDFSDNVQAPAYFQSTLGEYMGQLQQVELALANIFSTALGLAKSVDLPLTHLHDADSGSTGVLRASRYPAMPSEYDEAMRLVPHSDFGTMTIIYGTEKGLEEIRDGRWVEVPINKEKGELHVTIGQTFAMWSNELFANNIHRVSKNAAKDRISFAYFVGSGQTAGGNGIEPVCAKNEEARFPRTSSAKHVGEYIRMQMDGESVFG